MKTPELSSAVFSNRNATLHIWNDYFKTFWSVKAILCIQQKMHAWLILDVFFEIHICIQLYQKKVKQLNR
jgi:hypothetical protein